MKTSFIAGSKFKVISIVRLQRDPHRHRSINTHKSYHTQACQCVMCDVTVLAVVLNFIKLALLIYSDPFFVSYLFQVFGLKTTPFTNGEYK